MKFLNKIEQNAPEEAVAFFKQKGFKIGFDYRDVWGQSHAIAFTAAKAMQLSILITLRENIDNALKKGTPFSEFKKNIVPQLQKQGWWGAQQIIVDPKTGRAKTVNIGSSRLKNIYDTNLRTSYAEGQHVRIMNSKQSFPYLQYSGCNSMRPRPDHCALTGLTLPVESGVWDYIKPPRGFGCKCRVTQLTRSEGAGISDEPPDVRYENHENPRTGEKQKLPVFDWSYVNKKTGQRETVTWRADPSFNYPHGSYYEHLVKKLLAESESSGIPKAKTHSPKMMDSYKKLSKIGYKYKDLRADWPKLAVEQRLSAVDGILKDIKKSGKINDTLVTFWERQHYDNARRAFKTADTATSNIDKIVLAGEAFFELQFLIGMLASLPPSVQNVITKE